MASRFKAFQTSSCDSVSSRAFLSELLVLACATCKALHSLSRNSQTSVQLATRRASRKTCKGKRGELINVAADILCNALSHR